jgi:hypothetical protein
MYVVLFLGLLSLSLEIQEATDTSYQLIHKNKKAHTRTFIPNSPETGINGNDVEAHQCGGSWGGNAGRECRMQNDDAGGRVHSALGLRRTRHTCADSWVLALCWP